MWGFVLLGVSVLLLSLCIGSQKIMRREWESKKAELEELNRELEQMDELTDELHRQKKQIEELLSNEFSNYDALFKIK